MDRRPHHHAAAAGTDGAQTAPRRRRGRSATHSPEELLGLVAAVATAAVATGRAATSTTVSMPVFNALRADADRARGLPDPAADPERTPTAQAIQRRFSTLAQRPVSWADLLAGAARTGRTGRDQMMWLAALRRQAPGAQLSDAVVIHALALVAARITPRAATQRAYAQTRELLLGLERAHDGQDGVLSEILPTANQILAHCALRWENALTLAGLRRPATASAKPRPARPWASGPNGLPVAHAVALYAALNGTWPSTPALMQFAARTGFAMADPSGPAGPAREQAAELLAAHGAPVPTRTRGGGKGRRLDPRYPAAGLPGAPARADRQLAHTRRGRLRRRDRAVLSLRVWLVGLPADARRTRRAYAAWQVGTTWTAATTFDAGLGGFSALTSEAQQANTHARRSGGDPLADAHDLIKTIQAARPSSRGPRAPRPGGDVDFAQLLRAAMAGPHAHALTDTAPLGGEPS